MKLETGMPSEEGILSRLGGGGGGYLSFNDEEIAQCIAGIDNILTRLKYRSAIAPIPLDFFLHPK